MPPTWGVPRQLPAVVEHLFVVVVVGYQMCVETCHRGRGSWSVHRTSDSQHSSVFGGRHTAAQLAGR